MTEYSSQPLMSSSELTIRVSDLPKSERFYERILRPIGYQSQSRVSHDLSDGRHTIEATFGPVNTYRVDLRLSQTSQHTLPSKAERAQIDFYANSVSAVRQFFDTAVRSGASIVAHPSADGGQFMAGIRDPDGHIVYAVYSNPMTAAPREDRLTVAGKPASENSSDNNSTILSWAKGVADETMPQQVPGPRTATTKSVASPHATRLQRSPSAARTRRPASPSPAHSQRMATRHDDVNVKNIIAGAVAASAGAALAFGAYKEYTDSRQRESDHRRLLRRREELEAEAQAHARRSNAVAKRPADRDSGYYSINSVTKIYGNQRSQRPQSNTLKDQGRSQRSYERSRTGAYPDPRSQSVETSASESTAKPRKAIEARPSSSRRSRRGSETNFVDNRRNYITVYQPPSKPSRPTPPMMVSSYERESESRSHRHSTSRVAYPASKETTKRLEYHTESKPSSRTARPSKAASRAATGQSISTTRTARYASLPPSTIKTNTTVREARKKPLPSTPSRSKAGSLFEDLPSLAPGDSISNVSTNRDSRVTARG